MENLDYKGVMVFIEQIDGAIQNVSLELLGKARELACVLNTEVTAALLGGGVGNLCGKLAEYGADKVILVDDKALETYMTEPYAAALTDIVRTYKPEIMLYGATAIGRDLAPRVSARVRTGLTADCTSLEIQQDTRNLMMTRPAFGGNIMATILCAEHRPQMATVRPGVMKRIAPIINPTLNIIEHHIANLEESINVEIVEVIKAIAEKADISDAKILVSGGRGMGNAENFALLKDLADALGGEVAASRAAVDAGWMDKSAQVGQTGKTVRPTLYIACGISGAIQHLAGMEESEIIIAINKDSDAPIFDVADFGVVGDALKIIPLLIEAINRSRAVTASF